MQNALRDGNYHPAMLGQSITNPNSVVPVSVDDFGSLMVKGLLDPSLVSNVKYGYLDAFQGFVIGSRTGTVQNALCDLWEGPTQTYVFPSAGQRMQLVSTSANDSASGTGCQKVHIHYLDSNYDMREEEVILNGTTPVQTVSTDIFRINNMHAGRMGTSLTTIGDVSLQSIGGAVTYSFMKSESNMARQAIYTTPRGYYGYINHWQASSGSATGKHFTRVIIGATQHMGNPFPGVFLPIDEVGTSDNGTTVNFPTPIRVPEKTDVRILAKSDASNANVTATGAIMGFFQQM